MNDRLLIVGEVTVDYTLGKASSDPKVRLGGVLHAARGLWASDIEYSAAIICPDYLKASATKYLEAHGCSDVMVLGTVQGAPNVFVIGDVRETSHQGYENLLRNEKSVAIHDMTAQLSGYQAVAIFPGSYELSEVMSQLNADVKITIDLAYDIQSFDALKVLPRPIQAIAISTSSELFSSLAILDVNPLLSASKVVGARYLLLKENRGGSRIFDFTNGEAEGLPANLGTTVNSVGVGDAFTAVFAAKLPGGGLDAAWRGMQVATAYAQTTFPDDLRRDVRRNLKIPISVLRTLGGIKLPWHSRPEFQIYLAAPDFSYFEKPEVDAAVQALEYHNFRVRRPIMENGEANKESSVSQLQMYYQNDIQLLQNCSLVFAVPLARDPGTLIEAGMAMAAGKPVVTYDPRSENNNTMVMCGSAAYSTDLDVCLNGVFSEISRLREKMP